MDLFFLLVLLPACHWICYFQGNGPQRPRVSAQAFWPLGTYWVLFIYLFVPSEPYPHICPTGLQGEDPSCPPSEARACSQLIGTSIPYGLCIILGEVGGSHPAPLSPAALAGWEERGLSFIRLFILYVCICGEEVVCCFIFLRLWSVVYGFCSHPSLPMGTSKHRGDFSEQERGIPWSRESSAYQLLCTFPRNKYPLNFQTILSGVD